jgi:hypothetical protein
MNNQTLNSQHDPDEALDWRPVHALGLQRRIFLLPCQG